MKERTIWESREPLKKPLWEVILLILKRCRVGTSISNLYRVLKEGGVDAHRLTLTGYVNALCDLGVLDLRLVGNMKLLTLNGQKLEGLEDFPTAYRRRIKQVKEDRKRGVIDPLTIRKLLQLPRNFCPECGGQLIPRSGCLECPYCGWSCEEGYQP